MREARPILAGHLFASLNDELVALLRTLTPDEWNLPTVAGAWTVRDIASHLLDTALRRLSFDRDQHVRPMPPDAFANGLGAFINNANRDGVEFYRSFSTQMVIDMMDRYGAQQAAFLASKDPFAKATWSVSWAGEEESQNWFDVARELTERWHHQQHIRDAAGRAALHAPYLAPVIDAFMRALPYTYRDVQARVVVRVDDAAWSLVEGVLYEGEADAFDVRVTMSGDVAWRLFTKQKIEPQAKVEGDAALAEPLLGMIAIVA